MLTRLFSVAVTLSFTGFAHAASNYAGEFLSLGGGARSLALGNAYVAIADDATAGYWNPAGLVSLDGREALLMHAERFEGLVQHDFAAIARPGQRLHGIALSLVRVGVGNIHFTELEDPSRPIGADNRPLIDSTEQSADYAFYLSGGHRVGSRLALGLSVKTIYRQIASISAYGIGFDLGARYQLSRGIALATTLRDLNATPIIWNTGATDSVQPSLLIGVAYVLPLAGGQTTAVIASRAGGDSADNIDITPLNAGVEHRHHHIVLRAGFEEGRTSLGLGLKPLDYLDLDLAYLQHNELAATYQLSAGFRF